MTGPDLSVTLNGLTLPNPFVIGSGKGSSCANISARQREECLILFYMLANQVLLAPTMLS